MMQSTTKHRFLSENFEIKSEVKSPKKPDYNLILDRPKFIT